jgi:O-antigen/teichoic acid export membrane protein
MRTSRTLAVIAKNSIANLARQGAAWVVVLLLPPLLVRVLDKPSYATWVLILQLAAYVGMLDAGLQSAIARFVARADGLGDRRYMGRMLSSAGLILVLSSAVAAVLTLLAAWQLGHLFHGIPVAIYREASRALAVVGLSMAISLPFSTLAGMFAGLQRNEINAVAGSVGKILGACGAGWAAFHHQGLTVMAAWMAAGNLVQPAIYYAAWRKLAPHIHMARHLVDWGGVKEFSGFWSAMLIAQFGTLLISGLDLPIVVAFDFRAAAYYAIATTISNMLIVPQSAIVSTLMPVAAGISSGDSAHRLGEILIKTTRYATAILCLIAIPLMFGIHPFLRLWVGADYADHALPLAEVLIAAQLVRLSLLPYATIGFSVGQQNRMLISPFVEGGVNLVCSLVLVQWMGAIGVAIGTGIGSLVGVLIHFVISMPRTHLIAFSRRRLVFSGLVRPALCIAPPAAVMIVIVVRMSSDWLLAAGAVVTGMVAVVSLWFWNFDSLERRSLVGLLAGK